VRRKTLTVRAIALLGGGSAAIHQLRYSIGYGDDASAALAAHPHGYLHSVLPGIATAIAIALATLLTRVARGTRAGSPTASNSPSRGESLLRLWLSCAIALASIYFVQETVEGSGAVLHGGWIGIALAVPVGLLVALALRGARAAETISAFAPLVAIALRTVRTAIGPIAIPPTRVRSARAARGPPTLSVV
jgi:hypothetical protein